MMVNITENNIALILFKILPLKIINHPLYGVENLKCAFLYTSDIFGLNDLLKVTFYAIH